MSEFRIGKLYSESFETMPEKEITDNLEGICYGITHQDYTHQLTEEELAIKERELGQTSIKLKEFEDEKKEAMERIKEKMSQPKELYNQLRETIKYKSERKHGKVYMIDDQDSGFMYFFDGTGMCVDARPLKREERQTKMRVLNQKSNGDEDF